MIYKPYTWDEALLLSERSTLDAIQTAHMERACALLLEPGAVHELRAVKATSGSSSYPHTVRGFFDSDSHALMIRAALTINAPGIYYTLNPVSAELLGLARNRVKACRKGDPAAVDADVTRLKLLLVDIDPQRKTGTSASVAAHQAAHMLARGVRDVMAREYGWPAPCYADSGNGAHLLYRLDLDVSDAKSLVRRVLVQLAERFDTVHTTVDTCVFNEARISKLYGTWARKGDHHETAPHRLSQIIEAPEELVELTREQLLDFAPESEVIVPEKKRRAKKSATTTTRSTPRAATGRELNSPIDVDVVKWAESVDLELPSAQHFESLSGPGERWRLDECPCSRKTDGSAIMKAGDGTVSFKCHHDNCECGRDWKALRTYMEPPKIQVAKALPAPVKATVVSLAQRRDAKRADAAPAIAKVSSEYSWVDDLIYTQKGGIKNLVHNILLILSNDRRWEGVLALDEMSQRILKQSAPPWSEYESGGGRKVGPWTDTDTTAMQSWLAREYGFEPGVDRAHNCTVSASRLRAFHPVHNYLSGLTWDGTPRLDTWLIDHLHAEDTLYTRDVGRWWLISAVARIFAPGCKADHVLVLEGKQGYGKSSAFRALCSIGTWFCDSKIDMGSKDAMQLLSGKWIIELAELAGMSKKEHGVVKGFLTSSSDTYRPSYGRITEDFARRLVFGGSVNPGGNGYLQDPTGARRFWPVMVPRPVVIADLVSARDQLWAEAVVRFNAGDRFYPFTAEEDARCEREQNLRRVGDAWDPRVEEWLLNHGRPLGFITSTQLLSEALGIPLGQMDSVKQRRICAIMKGVDDWKSHRGKVEGLRARGWKFTGRDEEAGRPLPF